MGTAAVRRKAVFADHLLLFLAGRLDNGLNERPHTIEDYSTRSGDYVETRLAP